jgi:hypothetical protein
MLQLVAREEVACELGVMTPRFSPKSGGDNTTAVSEKWIAPVQNTLPASDFAGIKGINVNI